MHPLTPGILKAVDGHGSMLRSTIAAKMSDGARWTASPKLALGSLNLRLWMTMAPVQDTPITPKSKKLPFSSAKSGEVLSSRGGKSMAGAIRTDASPRLNTHPEIRRCIRGETRFRRPKRFTGALHTRFPHSGHPTAMFPLHGVSPM